MADADPPKVIRLDFRAGAGVSPDAAAEPAYDLGQTVELLAQLSQLQVGQGEQIAVIVNQLLAMNRLFERQAHLIAAMQRRIGALEAAGS